MLVRLFRLHVSKEEYFFGRRAARNGQGHGVCGIVLGPYRFGTEPRSGPPEGIIGTMKSQERWVWMLFSSSLRQGLGVEQQDQVRVFSVAAARGHWTNQAMGLLALGGHSRSAIRRSIRCEVGENHTQQG